MTLMLFYVFNELGEVPVGLYIKTFQSHQIHTILLVYVKDVSSLDGHGRLAFKVQYLITIVYGCFIMTLLYRKLFNTLSLLTIARNQRSYRVTCSQFL